MSIYKKFATDGDKIKYGVRFEIEGSGFICAYVGQLNPNYMKVAETTYRPFRNQMKTDTLAKQKIEELELDVFVGSILLGWDGVCDENGKELPYSKQNAVELMNKLPYLYEILLKLAGDISNYRPAAPEDDAKN